MEISLKPLSRFRGPLLIAGFLTVTGATADAQTEHRFSAEHGLILNFVRADRTQEFEAVMTRLGDALVASGHPRVRGHGGRLAYLPRP